MNILTVHLYVGFLVVLLALVAVWRRPERRITLYAVTVQIALGIWLMVQGLRVSGLHPALAVLAWAGYMVANVVGRREGKGRLGLIIAGVSSLLLLIAFGLGQMAVKAAG